MSKPHTNRLCTRDVEFRTVESDGAEGQPSDGHTLHGYAAVFGEPTEINNHEGHFIERIAPGAFDKSLSTRHPIMQWDHGRDSRVGSVPIGAFTELREDDKGLYCEARLFSNDVVEPVRQAIEAQAVRGMSFKFKVNRDEWHDNAGQALHPDELRRLLYDAGDRGPLKRTVREVQLFEAGPVSTPAYPQTSVGVRSLSDEDREAVIAEYRLSFEAELDRQSVEADRAAYADPAKKRFPIGTAAQCEASWREIHTKSVEDEYVSHARAVVKEKIEAAAKRLGAKLAIDSVPKQPEAKAAGVVADERDDAMPGKPYGDVKYADPGYQADKKHRYPIDTAAHVKAALAYIDKGVDKAKYSADDYAKVKAAIEAAAKKFGIGDADKEPDADDTESKSSEAGEAHAAPPAEERIPEDAARSGTSSGAGRKMRVVPVGATATDDELSRKVASKVNTMEELNARIEELRSAMIAMDTEARGADLDADDQTLWDEMDAEIVAARATIEKIEKRQARLADLVAAGSTERGTSFGAPAFHAKKGEDIYNLDEIRMASYGVEDFRERLTENARRAVEAAKMPGVKGREDSQERCEALLDSIDTEDKDLAKRYLATGSALYERAFGKAVRHGSLDMCTIEERQALIRAQALGTDSSGGFAVPFQLDPTVILTNAGVTNPVRDLARVEQIVGKQWQGVTSAGVTVVRGTEGAVAPDNSFTMAQPTLSTNRVQGFVPFNIEIDLAWNALRTEITKLLIDGKAREEDSFITGDGVTGTQPGGIVGSLSSGQNITAGGVASIAPNDIYATQTALPPRWEMGASWMLHKGIANRIRQFDTAGGAQMLQRIGDGKFFELMGYPVSYASAMASALTTGNTVMLYGDFEQFLIVDRIGMTVELIPHIFDTTTGRPQGVRGVYAVWMNNSKILVPAAFQALVTG